MYPWGVCVLFLSGVCVCVQCDHGEDIMPRGGRPHTTEPQEWSAGEGHFITSHLVGCCFILSSHKCGFLFISYFATCLSQSLQHLLSCCFYSLSFLSLDPLFSFLPHSFFLWAFSLFLVLLVFMGLGFQQIRVSLAPATGHAGSHKPEVMTTAGGVGVGWVIEALERRRLRP